MNKNCCKYSPVNALHPATLELKVHSSLKMGKKREVGEKRVGRAVYISPMSREGKKARIK
jgi:hypothetical protein